MPWGQRPSWPRVLWARSSGLRAERRVGVQHARGQALEEQGLLARDAQVAKAALRVREGEGEGARRRAGLVVALSEGQGRLSGGRHPRGEGQPHEAARREANALAQADHGVEHDAGRAGKRAPVEGLRVVGTAPAPEEARAVGLPFHGTLGPAFEAQDVNRPGAGLVRGARPPMTEEGGALRKVLRLDEQLAERGVGQVVGGRGEDDLARSS